MSDPIAELMTFVRETEALAAVAGRLGWDQETVMPEGSAGQRAEEIGALEGVLHARRTDPRLGRLTPRDLEVLSLMAKGAANQQIAAQLVITPAAVAKHVANIFAKLDLGPNQDNRRVRAVLAYLNGVR